MGQGLEHCDQYILFYQSHSLACTSSITYTNSMMLTDLLSIRKRSRSVDDLMGAILCDFLTIATEVARSACTASSPEAHADNLRYCEYYAIPYCLHGYMLIIKLA